MRRSSTMLSLLYLMLSCPALQAQELSPSTLPPEVRVSFERAAQSAKDAHFYQAVRLYNDALTQARSLKNPLGETLTLNALGLVYIRLSRPEKALTCFEQALEAAAKNDNKGVLGASL